MNDTGPEFNRNILISVDESENASRAVDYVAQLLGGLEDFRITLLHVIPEPEEDYFRTEEEKERWLEQYREKMDNRMENYRRRLIDAGFAEDRVTVRITMRFCPSMAKCILQERDQLEYSTIVVGRQGLSRSEEFLFGSISSKIVNHARDCTVWVVE
ncbi:MAG TPA: universal stress protein [Desulfobacterales bacterium]